MVGFAPDPGWPPTRPGSVRPPYFVGSPLTSDVIGWTPYPVFLVHGIDADPLALLRIACRSGRR